MNFLNQEDIYTNLKYLQVILDSKLNIDNSYELISQLQELSSNLGLSSFCYGSAIFLYQSKKTPESVALKELSKEIHDSIGKKLTATQSCLSAIKTDLINSKFQK